VCRHEALSLLTAVECLLVLGRGEVADGFQEAVVVNHQTHSRVANSTSSSPLQAYEQLTLTRGIRRGEGGHKPSKCHSIDF
jgi:hypothetical protein